MPQEKHTSRKPHGVLFFVAAFVVIVIVSFIFRKPTGIAWMENYQAGVQKSVELNKPALICFYHKGGPFTAAIKQGACGDPRVITFVETTFVPILVSIDDNPQIASAYDHTDYDGACFIRLPDGTQSDQATHGNRPPEEYIQKLDAKLKEVTSKKP